MHSLLQDIRHAWRGLAHSRGFSVMAIGTLALGIAAATAIFSVVDAVLLKPLPFRDPGRLVGLHERFQGRIADTMSAHEVIAWRDQNTTFEAIALYTKAAFNLTGSGEPRIVRALVVSANYFDVLGASARVGRGFVAGEDRSGANRIAVLSERLWHERFGGSASALSGTIVLDNVDYRVVGVMAAAENLDPDVWVPMDAPLEARRMGRHGIFAVGRLKADVSTPRAELDLDVVAKRLERDLPFFNIGHGVHVAPLYQDLVGDTRRPLLVLAGCVGFVLLIAGANVAHLLLTRAAVRQKEVAIRAALGASRARLVRFFLLDSLILGLVGGAVGVLLATWIVDLIPAITAVGIPRLAEASIDSRVLAACLAISVVTAALCGIIPAIRGSSIALTEGLGDGSRGSSAGPARISSGLALSEVALALVLLVGSALMIQSFLRLSRVNPGFNPEHVLAVPITLPGARYARFDQRLNMFEDLNARLAALPGVRAAGAVTPLPLSMGENRIVFSIEGRPRQPPGEEPRASLREVAGDYFRVMEIPLRNGRLFTPADRRYAVPLIRWFEQQPQPPGFDDPQPAPVAVINEALARRFFPDEDPIGRRIHLLFSPAITIVGIVGNVRHGGLAADPPPEIYLTHTQEPQSQFTVVVRTSGDPVAIAGAIRAQIRAMDKDLPLEGMQRMDEILSASLGRPRFDTVLLASFSGVALVLALIGIYGVTSYAVGQRTREFGIRAALGASRGDVLALVLGQSLRITAGGVLLGLVGAYALTGLLSRLLFGIEPTDPLTFGAVAIVMGGVSLLASYLPARAATTVDPLRALKVE
jgi:putative ABC transport system permease protein